MTEPKHPAHEEPSVEELEEEAAEYNPDPTTRREAFELELMAEGRSEEGEDVDIAEDLGEEGEH
jgi:hypothetical protein